MEVSKKIRSPAAKLPRCRGRANPGDKREKWAESWAGAEENLSALHAPVLHQKSVRGGKLKTELELREGQAHFYWSESWQPVAWCQRVEEKAVQVPRIGFVVESRERGEITSRANFPENRGVEGMSDSCCSLRIPGGVAIFQNSMSGRFLINPQTCFLLGLLRTELGEFPRVPSILSSVQL